MRLDDLRFFLRVAALGNLSAAGREFGLSPSASSSRLSALEKTVGAQLLTRTTRRTLLTEAGRVLLQHASVALREMDEALGALEASTEAPRGVLRISSNVFFGRKHVLPYLLEFRTLYPEVRIEMEFSDQFVDLMEDGYDMAIRAAPLPDSSLRARKLGSNRRVLCASPDYVARKGMPQSPADLAHHDLIGITSMPVWYFMSGSGEIALSAEGFITGDSSDFAYDAALSGLGVVIKSIAHIWEDLRDGRLVEVMSDYPVARSGEIWAVYPPGKFTPPKVSVFVDFLLSKYGRPAYWETDYHAREPGMSLEKTS